VDGAGQMTHFVKDDGYNTFRLPVAWQFFTNYVLGDPINADNMAKYDALVQVRIPLRCEDTEVDLWVLDRRVWLPAHSASSTCTTMLVGNAA
jgi:hypothetical protein